MAHFYENERRLGQLVSGFSVLAMVIAGLGLFGMAAFMAERRIKEIGIRKVLGATTGSIVGLLSRDFLNLVGAAIVLATPVAYLAMQRWLQDFAYRIELGPGIFLMAGLIALAIAFLTVSYQAIKAALTNPAESLRYE